MAAKKAKPQSKAPSKSRTTSKAKARPKAAKASDADAVVDAGGPELVALEETPLPEPARGYAPTSTPERAEDAGAAPQDLADTAQEMPEPDPDRNFPEEAAVALDAGGAPDLALDTLFDTRFDTGDGADDSVGTVGTETAHATPDAPQDAGGAPTLGVDSDLDFEEQAEPVDPA